MTVPLLIVYALMLWREKPGAEWFLGFAIGFFVLAIIFPQGLAPIEKGWMAFARVLSIVMTFVILTTTYYIVITPVALLLKLLGKDILDKKFDPEKKSYWIPIETDGPATRPEKPY